MDQRARPAVPPVTPAAVPPVPERDGEPFVDPLAEPEGVVPIEPNGHMLNLYRHREREREASDVAADLLAEAQRRASE